MTDRRLLKTNGRVAHDSLLGAVKAEVFSSGEPRQVCQPVAPLYAREEGKPPRRERELVLHEGFRVLEDLDGWAFGFAERDGYVGSMRSEALAPSTGAPPTHVIAVRQSYLVAVPSLKNSEDIEPISFGTPLTVHATHENGRWAEVARLRPVPDGHKTSWTDYVPTAHLRPVDQSDADPVSVAELFLGTPYHWGGNSGFGIDCSGLVQMAHLACGIACPGDSDLQEAALGDAIAPDAPIHRGDLFFWTGHVAMAVDATTLIHANAHHMAVAYEPVAEAVARIDRQGDGPVTSRRRIMR